MNKGLLLKCAVLLLALAGALTVSAQDQMDERFNDGTSMTTKQIFK